MHETGLIRDLVRRLEAAARDAGSDRIAGVTVCLGALSQISPEHFREHFDAETHGTIAEGATLTIECATDITDANAQSVVLRSVELAV